MIIEGPTTTLYRNFGWPEFNSVLELRYFSLHPDYFQGKQFWVGESGINMWRNSSFSMHFTAKVSIPTVYVTPGDSKYLFLESDRIIDMHPGGTILSHNLPIFNSVMKIDWIQYK